MQVECSDPGVGNYNAVSVPVSSRPGPKTVTFSFQPNCHITSNVTYFKRLSWKENRMYSDSL